MWRDYQLNWCDSCQGNYLKCECRATTCNGKSCEKCREDFKQFNNTEYWCMEQIKIKNASIKSE